MKNATEELKQYIPAQGGQVFVIVRGVSRSGMSRTMSFFVLDAEEWGTGDTATRKMMVPFNEVRLLDITRKIADLLGLRCKDGALTVKGGGMDMSFAVMDDVMGALYGKSGNDVSINVL